MCPAHITLLNIFLYHKNTIQWGSTVRSTNYIIIRHCNVYCHFKGEAGLNAIKPDKCNI